MEAANYLLRDALDPRSEEGEGAGACEALKGRGGYKGAQGQKEVGEVECTEVRERGTKGLNRGLDSKAGGEGTQVPAKQESAAMSA